LPLAIVNGAAPSAHNLGGTNVTVATRSDSANSDRLDFAIIGAGISGLYTAWRLVRDAQDRKVAAPSITIYDLAGHTGGRLLTWLPLGPLGGLRAELGGMRFMREQELVWALIGELGFADEIMKFPVDGPNLRLMLRGVSMPRDTPDPTVSYNLPDEDRARAQTLIHHAIERVLRAEENSLVLDTALEKRKSEDSKVDSMPTTREQWDKIKRQLSWGGEPLWDVGFWNLLSDVLTAECYQYIVDTLGYYSLAGNWNAAEAMEFIWLDFNVSDYFQLRRGYGILPDTLRKLVQDAGCKVQVKSQLLSFQAGDNGSYELELANVDSAGMPGEPFIVDAKHIVLAIPRRSIELLAPTATFDLRRNTKLRRRIESVRPQAAFKFYLFYAERWWERLLGITQGRSVCDLPIRQTYYFAPDPWLGPGDVPPFGLLMASYDDVRAVDYWRGLVPKEDEPEEKWGWLFDGLLTMVQNLLPNLVLPTPPPVLHKASQAMLDDAKTQLALLHDISESDIPEPVVGAYADWGADPFGGGWNFWNPRVDVQEVMENVRTPLGPERHVYIVGDSYSGSQGWVEGALTATEVTLQKHLGLEPPDWLPANYYLGW
jgi:hypothetical protein